MNTTQHQGRDHSQLFLVRLWAEKGVDNEEKEWHGRVQHIVSGEVHTFHDWPTLVDLLQTMLPSAGNEHPEGSER